MKIVFEHNLADNLTVEQLESVYKSVFSTEYGKIVLDDLALRFGILRTNFTDINQMYFLEGQKNLFFYIVSYLQEKSEKNGDKEENVEGDPLIVI